jgi:hypothetical protein
LSYIAFYTCDKGLPKGVHIHFVCLQRVHKFPFTEDPKENVQKYMFQNSNDILVNTDITGSESRNSLMSCFCGASIFSGVFVRSSYKEKRILA